MRISRRGLERRHVGPRDGATGWRDRGPDWPPFSTENGDKFNGCWTEETVGGLYTVCHVERLIQICLRSSGSADLDQVCPRSFNIQNRGAFVGLLDWFDLLFVLLYPASGRIWFGLLVWATWVMYLQSGLFWYSFAVSVRWSIDWFAGFSWFT